MPNFEITSPQGQKFQITAPEGATHDDVLKYAQANMAVQPATGNKTWTDSAIDFAKSIPHGMMQGASNVLSATGKAAAGEQGFADQIPDQAQTAQILEDNVTGKTHVPQGRAGKFGAAIGEGLGNPVSYVGPGGLGLKVAGSVLSSAGGEGGRQAAEGTPYETPASLVGALAGGGAAVRAFGPRQAVAAIPTEQELKALGGAELNQASKMGVDIAPNAFANKAAKIKSDLETLHGKTDITAPNTHELLDRLSAPPGGAAAVTVDNYRAAQQTLNGIAKDARGSMLRGMGGGDEFFAASNAKKSLADYFGNLPTSDVLAGDANAASAAIKRANANYAAGKRAENVSGKLDAAEVQTQTTGAGSNLDNKIRQKIAPLAINKSLQYGHTPEEIAQARQVAVGTPAANLARKLGKFGFNDGLTLLAHAAAALPTGGLSIPIGVAGTVSRKVAESLTKRQANKLNEMLRMRSPEYQSRLAALPTHDNSPNIAAMARSLLNVR